MIMPVSQELLREESNFKQKIPRIEVNALDKLIIHGGRRLEGEVSISGAKNAALPVMAASLLTSDPLQFSNVPAVQDIATALELMKLLGCKVDRQETRLSIDAARAQYWVSQGARASDRVAKLLKEQQQ